MGCGGDLDVYETEKVLFYRGSNLGPSSSKRVAVLKTLSRPVFEHCINSMDLCNINIPNVKVLQLRALVSFGAHKLVL